MLTWRPYPYPAGRDLVKGTILAVAFPDVDGRNRHRFGIYETRTREADGMPGLVFTVRDADRSTTADILAGRLPPVVFSADSPDDCVKWIMAQLVDSAVNNG